MIFNKYNLKKATALICAFTVLAVTVQSSNISAMFSSSYLDTKNITVSIDTTAMHKAISPYIYGINAESDLSGLTVNAIKQTDPRVSSYNWESNFSNSGTGAVSYNDSELTGSYPQNKWNEPALYTEYLVTKARRYGIASRYVTLQMMGLVAADSLGAVYPTDGNSRWRTVLFNKNDSYLSQPNISDIAVYIDEYVSFLANKYGYAVDGGINGFFLDNEPENWAERFPSAVSSAITADRLVSRSAELAEAVKKIDPTALVYGPSINGIEAFINLKNPTDWEQYSAEYSWFIDYYLMSMNNASQKAGTRLLDVLDLHYHTEATNGLLEPIIDNTNNFSNNTRLQAPRILWDSTYTENSTIAYQHNQQIPLIPTLEASINMYYPGTKLSFSEYNFGGGNHISGGISTADALGIFASYGVHMACLKPNTEDFEFQKSAINLYTNYDGNGGNFGDTLVKSDNGGDIMSSVYASIDGDDETTLKAVLINKNQNNKKNAEIKIDSNVVFESVKIYGFSDSSSEIVFHEEMEIENNTLSFDMKPLSVYMFVFNGIESGNIIIDEPIETNTDVSEEITIDDEMTTVVTTEASIFPEHVSAETYSSAGTTAYETQTTFQTEIKETITSVSIIGTDTDGETITEIVTVKSPSYNKTEAKVPAAVKVIVSALVIAVLIGMGYILFNGNHKSNM